MHHISTMIFEYRLINEKWRCSYLVVINIFQCAKRWKEIQQTSAPNKINPSWMHSSAGSNNLSSFLNSVLHFADDKQSTSVTVTQGATVTNSEPATREANFLEEQSAADRDPG